MFLECYDQPPTHRYQKRTPLAVASASVWFRLCGGGNTKREMASELEQLQDFKALWVERRGGVMFPIVNVVNCDNKVTTTSGRRGNLTSTAS